MAQRTTAQSVLVIVTVFHHAVILTRAHPFKFTTTRST